MKPHKIKLNPILFFFLLFFILLVAGCDNRLLESESRKAAVSYFYGENAHDGYMLFTWEDVERETKTKQKRSSLGLNEDWIYWDEQFNVISLGDFDYYIIYSISFKNSKTDEMFIREEKYFSVDENHWEPTPLMHEYFRTDPETGKMQNIKIETF